MKTNFYPSIGYSFSCNHEQGGDFASKVNSTYATGGCGQTTNFGAQVYRGGSYDIYRRTIVFDTSAIPANAVITLVKFNAYIKKVHDGDCTNSIVYLCPVSATGNNTAYYNKAYFGNSLGECNQQDVENDNVNIWWSPTIDPSSIVKGGNSIFGLRHWNDYNNYAPWNDGTGQFYFAENNDATYRPYLEITYFLPATVSNSGVSNIINNGARLSGNVGYDGGGTISDRGFIIDGSVTVHVGTGTGAYYADITGFNDGSTHTFKPFAINEAGTVYGETISFKTLAGATNNGIVKKSSRKFTPIANVSSAENYTSRGFQYGLTETPTWGVSESGVFTDSSFTMEISGLKPFTLYHYRAFVQNQTGVSYSPWTTIKTDGEGGGILIL